MQRLENYWMPFTANQDFKQSPRLVKKAKGVYLWAEEGHRIIDASSGLFCVGLGHCRSEIIQAVKKQMETLDYSSPFQLGQEKSFQLAEKLAKKLPESIDYLFFTNSGSESVDTAIKMATVYHRANGENERTVLVSRERAYHGINIGGTSLAGIPKNREAFSGITLPVHFMRDTWTGKNLFCVGQPENGSDRAYDLEKIINVVGAKNISAVFIEPIAGSTGVLIPPINYLKIIREICDKYGILLIFDEVITGFCRTGNFFASETFDVVPDIMTMAKTLTNGCIPMGAVACKKEIYDAVMSKEKNGIEFFHGYTYSGHPAACAAALASLDIFEKDGILENVRELIPYFTEKMLALKDLPNIKDIRIMGLIAGIEFHSNGAPGNYGMEATKKLFQNGLHIKFTGDAGIMAPPLISTKENIDEIYDIFSNTLK